MNRWAISRENKWITWEHNREWGKTHAPLALRCEEEKRGVSETRRRISHSFISESCDDSRVKCLTSCEGGKVCQSEENEAMTQRRQSGDMEATLRSSGSDGKRRSAWTKLKQKDEISGVCSRVCYSETVWSSREEIESLIQSHGFQSGVWNPLAGLYCNNGLIAPGPGIWPAVVCGDVHAHYLW